MVQEQLSSIGKLFQKQLSALMQFLKRNYRNYYDDRSWWDEVGS